jgi:proline iminopeptidase
MVCRMKMLIAGLLLACATAVLAADSGLEKFVITDDGARIAYYPLGTAQTVPLIVLAGGPGTDARYMRVRGALDELARGRTVVLYDQRGTRGSTDSNGSETIDRFVADIETVRKAVDAPTVDLLGHSFGGYLAIAYTARHPANVRSLIFLDSSGPRLSDVKQLMAESYPDRIDAWRAKRATLGANATTADIAIFLSMEFVHEAVLEQYLEAVRWHRVNVEVNDVLRKDMEARDYSEQVRGFRQPALVLHGRHDAIIAPVTGWRLHKMLPNSTFHVFEDAGHSPHIEKPEAFLAIVRPFLQTQDSGGRR